MPVWLIIAVTTLYVLGLFFIAWKGDKTALTTKEIGPFSGVGYALALIVDSLCQYGRVWSGCD